MPEPVHDEALVNLYLEQISALSISAFDGADVNEELGQVVREAVDQCSASKTAPQGNNLSVLIERLTARSEAAAREGQPQVRDTFSRAAELARAPA
ncbi:hypothetical protein [Cupriavidus basilensis]|uniref:Uncharacterized protein n=1 Tax=Cupriavidus basilensis TaxID=68895 RepID=A0A643FVW8_9BURK|nr:hypothetical protein [Cupriavidus basilensis]NUA31377.1 hypothetical protein [Cupriavidus basilensis]QOT77444.1 hypothetical protein F7R26_005140 [Cupriavidus basilensis]